MKIISTTCMRVALGSFVALLLIGSAQATSVTGSIWENQPSGQNATVGNVPSGPADVTFTAPGNLNLHSNSGPGGYTIGAFLASGGGTFLTGASQAGNTLNNTIFDFKGSVTVTNGETFTAGHDDGLTLIIDGITVISAPGPTSFNLSTSTYTGPSGTYNFELVYVETDGAPADLVVNLPLSSVPEPGTLAMLSSGLLGLGGFLKRKLL